MKMKTKRLSPWIGKSLLLCAMLIGILSPFILAQVTIPSTVRVLDGESWQYDWLQMDVAENEWLTVHDTAIEHNSQIESTGIVQTEGVIKLWGIIPLKAVSLEVWPKRTLQVGGNMVGIDLFTDGILVLGTGKIQTVKGEEASPARGVLYAGDRIRSVNGEKVETVEEMEAVIATGTEAGIRMEIEREGERKTVTVIPKIEK